MGFAALVTIQPAERPDAGMPIRKRDSAMSTWRAKLLVAMALVFATIGTSSAVAAETNLRFTLDRKFEGPAAAFLLPLDRGYYKAEGLNVSIDPAQRTAEAIKRVASGDYEM